MPLADSYVQVYGKLGEVFRQLEQGQAPGKFTVQYLKDLGFASTNFRAVIPLLKSLGFLSAEGVPTARYLEYRNGALSKKVMGAALKEAYSDLFTIRANPTPDDRKLIEGKFKSAHNVSPNVAKLMASTFYALLELAELSPGDAPPKEDKPLEPPPPVPPPPPPPKDELPPRSQRHNNPTLHYNIQIHLPATKDVEVFNAIFKSLRDHLLE